jgi:ubiquinone/menaquinone biosynthesis C-methylase UbiE
VLPDEQAIEMKLNTVEMLLVNNPVRAVVQRLYETPLLRHLGGRLDGARVLEIGCGRGAGVEMLLKQFGARQVYAIDIDPLQLRRAERRLAAYTDGRAVLQEGSAERLPFADGYFDAVFDFGVLHHVPKWQTAVADIARVLRPGGRFFFEEVTRDALQRWLYRTFLEHPTENRFSEAEFVAELAIHGIDLPQEPRRILRNDIFIGVGQVRRH